ncbi:MAG: hypothetical protein R3C09_15500 [Pirellulaceae bacterium]
MTQLHSTDRLHQLPSLAGLCSLESAVAQGAAKPNGDLAWSVEHSTERLKRLHYVLKRLCETLTAWIPSEPIYELKTLFSHHAYLCAEQVELLRRRVSEMREPPLGLDRIPHAGLEMLLDEITAAPTTQERLWGVYSIALPAVLEACTRLQSDAHPLADAPTVRVAKLIHFELSEALSVGQACIEALVDDEMRSELGTWSSELQQCLTSAGQLDGTRPDAVSLPAARYSSEPFVFSSEPQRDERFQDSFNAGVNPEAFLYDERFSAQDKTLMMHYKRLRELDVPEMMASILVELREQEPWEFHYEMTRQMWDEARHAMMGEVGFASLGIDWTQIPINFTWSRNLNAQLDARERHGVLFFIEQGLMPRTGKRYEWEVGLASGQPLSGLFQDFDWADEVLHAQIGRRWYVPRYSSLNQALEYGDKCWSKVLSHWREYREQGLTEHRNWWPELYSLACERWGKTPDPAAMAFAETYESSRADLQKLE